MGDKGPCHLVDARKACERGLLQDGQRAVVAGGKAFADLPQLILDQVEIVEKPLCAGSQLMALLVQAGDVPE